MDRRRRRNIAVTIGLPFRAETWTLEQAIRSIFAQDFGEWELLLVDDGASEVMLNRVHQIRDDRVKVISDGRSLGLAARLNQIARLALGRCVARMDADDVMHPNRISRQLAFLDDNPSIDVVGSAAYVISNQGRVKGVRGSWPLDMSRRSVLQRGLFIHPTVMGRVTWFLENPYDESFKRAQDHELWCRTSTISQFGIIREPLLFYRERSRFSFDTYRETQAYNREIWRRYGPPAVGRIATLKGLTGLRMKTLVYWSASAFGLADHLVTKRNLPIGDEEALVAESVLTRALATRVPGWD